MPSAWGTARRGRDGVGMPHRDGEKRSPFAREKENHQLWWGDTRRQQQQGRLGSGGDTVLGTAEMTQSGKPGPGVTGKTWAKEGERGQE